MRAPGAKCYSPVERLLGWALPSPRRGLRIMGSVVAPVVSILAGAVLGVTTLMGVVSSQTAAPEKSPGNVEQPTLEYGTVTE
jgi:hypothetical protein